MDSDSPKMTAAVAALPVAPWVGGKRNLATRICAILDAQPCVLYAEPFIGMGGIFLRRKRRPAAEVINDRSKDVANLFRILQRHYPQFLDVLKFQLTTRVEFNRLVDTNPETLTDLERAARFLYLQRTAFGGKLSGRNFGITTNCPARFNLTTLEPMLEDLHSRLAGVVIECLDWQDFLHRYDRPETMFYLDPPYWGCEDIYGKGLFDRSQFAAMAAALRALKGRFLLSINDTAEVREIFTGFDREAVDVSYRLSGTSGVPGKKFPELLISNFR